MSNLNNEIQPLEIQPLEIEPLKIQETGDLYQLGNKLYELLNIKLAVIIFFIYVILNSDIFIENTISKYFNNIYDITNDKLTEKGIILSGILLSLCYLIIDLLDKKKII
jgi:hypothetical protein